MKLFKRKRSKFSHAEKTIHSYVIARFRSIGKHNDCAPTEKTSDQMIVDIYKMVGSSFREVAKERKEHITAGSLNTIVFKFYQVYELGGDELLKSHLDYEIGKYLQEGLREDYKHELKLL